MAALHGEAPLTRAARPDPFAASPDALLVLEVKRGRTLFRFRPVSRDRFTLGGDPGADLRLGGNVPLLHSLILFEDGEHCLEAIAAAPRLLVNGRHVRSVMLQDGDQVTIGSIELQVHLRHVPAEASLPAVGPDLEAPADEAPELATLSASELVDLLERESSELQRLRDQREMGARALIEAAHGRVEAVSKAPESDDPSHLPSVFPRVSIESVPRHMVLATQLEGAGQALSRAARVLRDGRWDDQDLAQSWVALLEMHQELTAHVETLAARLEGERSDVPPLPTDRAIA